MGLFDKIFKTKKEEVKQPVKINESDSFGDIAVKLTKSGIVSVPKDRNHNTFGESLDKLDNGELPWGWVSAKADFYKPRDKKLYSLSTNIGNARSIDEEIELIQLFIEYYYEYKNECISLGECYFKYFEDMHMHCHNSRNDDFEFVSSAEERLQYIQENYNVLIEEEKAKKELEEKKQNLLNSIDLNAELEEVIKTNPGILQSDLYKQFDSLLKDDISTILYYWSKDNKIQREKSGRSYKLFWV